MTIALILAAIIAVCIGFVAGRASKNMTAPASTSFLIFGPLFGTLFPYLVGVVGCVAFGLSSSAMLYCGVTGIVGSSAAIWIARNLDKVRRIAAPTIATTVILSVINLAVNGNEAPIIPMLMIYGAIGAVLGFVIDKFAAKEVNPIVTGASGLALAFIGFALVAFIGFGKMIGFGEMAMTTAALAGVGAAAGFSYRYFRA